MGGLFRGRSCRGTGRGGGGIPGAPPRSRPSAARVAGRGVTLIFPAHEAFRAYMHKKERLIMHVGLTRRWLNFWSSGAGDSNSRTVPSPASGLDGPQPECPPRVVVSAHLRHEILTIAPAGIFAMGSAALPAGCSQRISPASPMAERSRSPRDRTTGSANSKSESPIPRDREADGGVDEAHHTVGLHEISPLLSRAGIEVLGQQAKAIAAGKHALE
jgi:hypothetical protein